MLRRAAHMNQMLKYRFLWDLRVSSVSRACSTGQGDMEEETSYFIMGHFCPASVGSLSIWNVHDGSLWLLSVTWLAELKLITFQRLSKPRQIPQQPSHLKWSFINDLIFWFWINLAQRHLDVSLSKDHKC